MVISELLNFVRNELSENAAFEAKQIVKKACAVTDTELIINGKAEVLAENISQAEEMTKRRKNGEPLQYILGEAEFMSLEFEVNEHTLIPRSDTETLVEAMLEEIGDKSVTLLDIGTGTGCIGISMAHYANAEVTLADISCGALKTAERNAARNGVSVKTLQIDILSDVPNGKFDAVVSNPPYIESDVIPSLQTEVRDYEPISALDGGADGLKFYRRIVEIAPSVLNDNGLLAFEIGFNQGNAVFELMSDGFKDVKVIKDLCGNDRVVMGRKRN